MSRRAEKICGWDGGLTVGNLLNYTRNENEHKVRKKTVVFYYVAVICTTTGGQNRQERRSSGRGSVNELRAVETYKKQKNRYQLRLFLLIKHVDLKIITEIVENHLVGRGK